MHATGQLQFYTILIIIIFSCCIREKSEDPLSLKLAISSALLLIAMSVNDDSMASAPAIHGPSIAPDQFSQLMEAIASSQTQMEHRFAEFWDEVRKGQEDAASKALKRAKYEKPYIYRRKSNEEQSIFNSCLDETVAEAETELTAASSNTTLSSTTAIARARECLQRGWQLLAERQKLIRIADWLEHGWGVVVEYTADELADDSGDEKWFVKAERAAEHKAVKRKKKRGGDEHRRKDRPSHPRSNDLRPQRIPSLPSAHNIRA